jgi:hypothetical protein
MEKRESMFEIALQSFKFPLRSLCDRFAITLKTPRNRFSITFQSIIDRLDITALTLCAESQRNRCAMAL